MDDEDYEETTILPHKFQWGLVVHLLLHFLARFFEAISAFWDDLALASASHVAWRMERRERKEFEKQGMADIEKLMEG